MSDETGGRVGSNNSREPLFAATGTFGPGTAELYEFGPFCLEPAERKLSRNNEPVVLSPKAFDTLLVLVRNSGHLLEKDEFIKALWPDSFVEEGNLTNNISLLRKALGDDLPYIETVPKGGYRFIGAVRQLPKTVSASQERRSAELALVSEAIPERRSVSAVVPSKIEKNRSPQRRWVPPVVAAVPIVIAVALLVLNAGGLRDKLLSRSSAQHQIHSLAVLPLTNLSGDPEQEYLADGMTEELITELSRIGSLKVISRTSVTQYKGEKKKSLPQIGRELNVDAVMEGSVLRSGNRVRVVAHMIYAPTDQNLMVETYERDIGDVLKLQREVAESITQQVRVKLTPEQQARLHQAPEVNPDAYQAYLRATYLDWSQHKEIERAQRYLEKAIEKDPSFAEAYAMLAALQSALGDRWQSPKEAFPPAKQAIHKALELDEKNCHAHMELARISWRYDWDWQTADREFLYALKLCPNATEVHYSYVLYTASNGRSAEALAEMARIRELDPIRSEPLASKSVINYHLRNYKALIEINRAFVARASNFPLAHLWLGVGYEGSGQTREAIPEYQKATELRQGDSDATAALAHANATTGRKAEALKILREWQRQSETSYVSPYMIATVHAGLGDKDKAFEFLEKAYQERSPDLPYFLRADLRMDSLRSDPRFQDLMHRMNFPN
jgi:TolB-like protein/DNA-binding winged helix-turn-helix (wHTH) protein/tetratricopeptide (TPR) repeat protein